MNLSKTSKYAIRVVSYMALKNQEIYSATQLSEALQVSDKYLKRILTTLSNHAIIQSLQGRYGGFRLNKRINDINLYEIIDAVEDINKYIGCVLGFQYCSEENSCSLHKDWAPIQEKLTKFFKNTTIAEVIKNPSIMKF